MQIAESIERVKAVRLAKEESEPLEVPYILRKAHQRFSSNLSQLS